MSNNTTTATTITIKDQGATVKDSDAGTTEPLSDDKMTSDHIQSEGEQQQQQEEEEKKKKEYVGERFTCHSSVQISKPFCARFGIFCIPSAETGSEWASNHGRSWTFLGTVDPDDSEKQAIFFVGEPNRRGRIYAVQRGEMEEAIPADQVNQFTTTQPATMASFWCPQVDLGEHRWRKFMTQDDSIKDDLTKLLHLLRRHVDGYDGDCHVYVADELLSEYDELVKAPVIM